MIDIKLAKFLIESLKKNYNKVTLTNDKLEFDFPLKNDNFQKDKDPEWLFTFSFSNGNIDIINKQIIFEDVNNCLQFTDRPFRLMNNLEPEDIKDMWNFLPDMTDSLEDEINIIKDSFLYDPPNAAIYANDKIAIVELIDCKLINNSLVFKFDYLNDSQVLDKSFSNGSVFIDMKDRASVKLMIPYSKDIIVRQRGHVNPGTNCKIVWRDGRMYVINKRNP